MPIEIPGAVLARLESLRWPDATIVTVHFDDAPLEYQPPAVNIVYPPTVKVLPPYVVLVHDGTTPQFTEEYVAMELCRLRVEVYARSLAQAEQLASVVRYNAIAQKLSAPNDPIDIRSGQGLDFAAGLDATAHESMSVMRKRERYIQETGRAKEAMIVFRCSIEYEVMSQRIG